MNNNLKAFFALLRAGLWEQECRLLPFGKVDYAEVQQLAEEQSVVGLVTAGLEHVMDMAVPKEELLQFIGQSLQIEYQNKEMNSFIGMLVNKMRGEGIYTLLVKGQGIAQCYERPLWRSCGDVDFFLSDGDYAAAKRFLTPLASKIDEEYGNTKHQAMTIGLWEVELHGTLRSELWKRIDRELDSVQRVIFCEGKVRSWMNGSVEVFLPRADEDVVYVFAHILQHFFNEGIGLRQICDWCRLLWTYQETINAKQLFSRIQKMGAMTEWKSFASLAVNYLGMPQEAMPLYSPSKKWKEKANKILDFIQETGNFGHNRDLSFRQSSSVIERKIRMFWHITSDKIKQFSIFPIDSLKVWIIMMKNELCAVLKR